MRTLITLEYYKDTFKVTGTTNDTILNNLLHSCTSLLEEETGNRSLFVADSTRAERITEYFSPSNNDYNVLNLRSFPIDEVESLREDSDRDFNSDDEFDTDDYTINKEEGQILYEDNFTEGSRTVRVVYRGGFHRYNIPHALKYACAVLVDYFYKRDVLGFSESSEEEGRRIYDVIPPVVRRLIRPYVRKRHGLYGDVE